MASLLKKFGVSVIILLASVAPASATGFTLSSFSVDLRDTDPGLVVYSSGSGGPLSFDLSQGQSVYQSLFTLGTKETALNWDDVVPYPISVTLNFSSPSTFGGVSTGITGALLGGYLIWDNPLLLNFGSGGLLAVSLTGGSFPLPGQMNVGATFTLVKSGTGGSVSVPEPASILLLLVGAVALVIFRSRTQPATRRQ